MVVEIRSCQPYQRVKRPDVSRMIVPGKSWETIASEVDVREAWERHEYFWAKTHKYMVKQ